MLSCTRTHLSKERYCLNCVGCTSEVAGANPVAVLPLQGVAINFVKSDDIRILRDIEQFYSTQVQRCLHCCFCIHSASMAQLCPSRHS